MVVKVAQSCPTLCDPMDCSPWNSQGQNTDVGSLSLLQGIPNQWSNPGLLHCRWILYQLNHKGSPRILKWVAYPFSYGFPRIRTGSPALQAGRLCSIPGLGRSPGEGKGYPLQYSGLENCMDGIVHGVAKSRIWLSDFHVHKLNTYIQFI